MGGSLRRLRCPSWVAPHAHLSNLGEVGAREREVARLGFGGRGRSPQGPFRPTSSSSGACADLPPREASVYSSVFLPLTWPTPRLRDPWLRRPTLSFSNPPSCLGPSSAAEAGAPRQKPDPEGPDLVTPAEGSLYPVCLGWGRCLEGLQDVILPLVLGQFQRYRVEGGISLEGSCEIRPQE